MRALRAFPILVMLVTAGCAGAPDTTPVDSGAVVVSDSGPSNEDHVDAGSADAGTPDGGRPDPGAPDAGRPDAGKPDAGGPIPDPPDAGPIPTDCRTFGGVYWSSATAGCDLPLPDGTPDTFCVLQTGCAVTVTAGAYTLTGVVSGDNLTATGSVPSAISCNARHDSGSVFFQCKVTKGADQVHCDIPLDSTAGPGASGTSCCDPVAQQCGAGLRCTIGSATSSDPVVTGCVPTGGTKAESADCTRTGTTNDDCDTGLFCTRRGRTTTAPRWCRKLCRSANDCTSSQVCRNEQSVPHAGTCLPACTLFGNDCGAGLTCRDAPALDAHGGWTFLGSCSGVGTKTIGGFCSLSTDCGDSAGCYYTSAGFRCRAMCDASHPCADSATTCETTDLSTGAPGYCVPR